MNLKILFHENKYLNGLRLSEGLEGPKGNLEGHESSLRFIHRAGEEAP